MQNNKTAVDWLVEKLNQCEPWYSAKDVPVAHINSLIESAKEMEQEQISYAFNNGYLTNACNVRKTGNTYYFETYQK